MTTYIVTYSLGREEKKYKGFFASLEALGGVKLMPGAYLAKTTHSLDEMRVALLPYLEQTDRLLIAPISGEVALRNAACPPETLQRLFGKEG